jgi:hypothetical protein
LVLELEPKLEPESKPNFLKNKFRGEMVWNWGEIWAWFIEEPKLKVPHKRQEPPNSSHNVKINFSWLVKNTLVIQT